MEISNFLSKIQGSATAQIFSKARELEDSGKDIVHLEIGQPDYSPPQAVIDATVNALKDGKTTYTVSRGIEPLRKAVADLHSREDEAVLDPKTEVIITPGGKLGIFGSIWAVTNPGDNVIVLNPSWVSYGDIIESLGAEVRYLAADGDFTYDKALLKEMTDSRTKAIVINSPSNPTGGLITKENLVSLTNHCRENDILVVSDEMYNNYVYEGEHHSLLSIPDWKDIGVVVNGFSKTFSMTGYRLGYVLGRKAIIDQVNKVMQLTASCPVNFAQHAAIVAIDHIEEMRSFIADTMKGRRDLVVSLLAEIGIDFEPPKGAIYAWFKVPDGDSTAWASRLLEEQGVAVTPGRAFGPDGEGYARICFATKEDNLKEGIRRIGQFIS